MRTGYCGSEGITGVEVEDDTTDEELWEMAWEMAVDHAASYGQEFCSEGDYGDDCEDDSCDMEHGGSTSIEGYWEDYDPDKHDHMFSYAYPPF